MLFRNQDLEFPGNPVVRTQLSHRQGPGSIPGWGTKIPQAARPKNRNCALDQLLRVSFLGFFTGLSQEYAYIHTYIYICVYFCICVLAYLVVLVVSDSLRHYGPWPSRLLCPWDSPGKNADWSGLPFPSPISVSTYIENREFILTCSISIHTTEFILAFLLPYLYWKV